MNQMELNDKAVETSTANMDQLNHNPRVPLELMSNYSEEQLVAGYRYVMATFGRNLVEYLIKLKYAAIRELEAILELCRPWMYDYESSINASGDWAPWSMSFLLHVGPQKLVRWMRDNGWLYKKGKANHPTQTAMEKGWMVYRKEIRPDLTHRKVLLKKAQPLVTQRGLVQLAMLHLVERADGSVVATGPMTIDIEPLFWWRQNRPAPGHIQVHQDSLDADVELMLDDPAAMVALFRHLAETQISLETKLADQLPKSLAMHRISGLAHPKSRPASHGGNSDAREID